MASTRRLTQFVLTRRVATTQRCPLVIGMVHVPPLPGTPHYRPGEGSMGRILEKVRRETGIYAESGVVSHDTSPAITHYHYSL